MKKLYYMLGIVCLLLTFSCNENKPDGTPRTDDNSPNSDMSGHSGGSNKVSNSENYGEHSDTTNQAGGATSADTSGTRR